MTMSRSLIRCCLSVTLFCAACNYVERKGAAPESAAGPESAKERIIDFASVKSGVLLPRCISCHQQYADYQGVKGEIQAIRRAVETNRMPRSGGPLSDSERALLFKWIDSGAPENAEPSTPSTPAPLSPDWTSISKGLIFPKCVVCHNPQGQAKFLDLSTLEAIVAQKDRAFPGGVKLFDTLNPERSYVIDLVTDEEEPMPPPPPFSNIPRLSANEVEVLTEWIRRGLK